MAKFAKPSNQAANVMKQIQGSVIPSVGTVRNFESCLRVAAQWAQDNRIPGGLRGMTPEDARKFLSERSTEVSQATLNQNRHALEAMMHHVTQLLSTKESLGNHFKGQTTVLNSRTYDSDQVEVIARHQSPRNALATRIAFSAGLRASELLSIRQLAERSPSDRPALESKFCALPESVAYTVHGKGGLIREIRIPTALAQRLEQKRLPHPITILDRGIRIQCHYDIGGGNAWSASFSRASKRAFGWSRGGHGLRHSFAQNRMKSLQKEGFTHHQSKETVSQELGHFRPDITDTYLR